MRREPPYDEYQGTAPSGATVSISSAYGGGSTVAGGDGHWWVKVEFPGVVGQPYGTTFTVTVSTPGYAPKSFEFTYTGS